MSRLVDDETVLLDLESGMYFGLDGVGQRIWQSVTEGKTLAEIAGVISAEYEVDEDQALADILDFTSNLVERGLLKTA
jgi:hypothetical protein